MLLHGGWLEQVRQWRRKRVLMRPEAAFPYVFAAEGPRTRRRSRLAQRPATLIAPPPRLLQAELFFSAATNIRTGRGALLWRGLVPLRRLFTWDYAAFVTSCPRLRPQRSFCRRAVLPCSSDVVAGGPFFFAVM